MALRPILVIPDAQLRRKADLVPTVDAPVRARVAALFEPVDREPARGEP